MLCPSELSRHGTRAESRSRTVCCEILKSPPVQHRDDVARQMVEAFIASPATTEAPAREPVAFAD
jgi:hypothetical protein